MALDHEHVKKLMSQIHTHIQKHVTVDLLTSMFWFTCTMMALWSNRVNATLKIPPRPQVTVANVNSEVESHTNFQLTEMCPIYVHKYVHVRTYILYSL